MKATKRQIAGWVLSALLAILFIGLSARMKLMPPAEAEEMFGTLGFSAALMFKIGIVEIVITVLFLIPQTAFLGAVLLTAYLGGATAAHVRAGDDFFVPIIIGVIVWIALGLRRTGIFRIAFGGQTPLARPVPNE